MVNEDIRILVLNVRGLKDHDGRRRKLPRLIDLINRYGPDFVFLQETHIDDNFLANAMTVDLGLNTGFHSLNQGWAGTAVLVTSDRWKVVGNMTDDDTGRIVTVDVTRNNTYYTLVNIYAHSGSANQDRRFFFELILDRLQTARHNIILGGDFNVTLRDIDREDTDTGNANIGRTELQNIVDTYKLKDGYHDFNSDRHRINMTHFHSATGRGARIDRLYTPQDDTVTHYEHIEDTLVGQFTDHKAVFVVINSPSISKHRSPHYKLNDTILEDEHYDRLMKHLIHKHLYPIPDLFNRGPIWDFFKQIVGLESSRISKLKHRERETRLNDIQNILDDFHRQGNEENDHILSLKEELNTILEYKYQGAAIRSKIKMVNDETASPTFLALENNIQKSRQIHALQDEHGTIHTDKDKITEMLEAYYKELFTKEAVDTDMQDIFLEYATVLTNEQRDTLETPITQTQLKYALNTLNDDSTPGPDGLSYRWYKKYFSELGPFFVKLLEECLEVEMLTDSQNLNFTSLMLKDVENPHLIKNYRPLSLLNSDYKIFTKAFALRTSTIMPIVIKSDQVASVKGRKITDLNNYIRDIITYAEHKQTHTCILSLDQMKAFDRVDHSWMHKLLEKMNFGPYFRKFVRTIYAAPRGCVLANHTLSNVFEITRSVRQGDPLSSFLYTITLEPFLERIRQDINIQGISLPGGIEQKLVAFADDAYFFPRNYRSIRKIMSISDDFGRASGSKINVPKTKLMALGSFKIEANDGLNWVREMKMLGIFYKADKDNPGCRKQWEDLANKIQKTVGLLKYKKASIFGRAILANTLLTPKLNYLIQSLHMPDDIHRRIRGEIRKFIFSGTTRSVRHTTLIQPKLLGGINLQDIETKIQTYRIQYMHNIITNATNNTIGRYYFSFTFRRYIQWQNNTAHHDITTPLPKYYNTLLTTYRQHTHIFEQHVNTKLTYRTLLNEKNTPIGPIHIQRARQYINFDYRELFKNLHKRFMTPHQKNITYRILFSFTPTSIGLHRQTNTIQPCPICKRTNIQETETHIFFTCPSIQLAKHTLTRHLISNTNNIPAHYNENTYKAIFLNTVPTNDRKLADRQLAIVASYRQIIWEVRLKSKFDKKKFTQEAIKTKFKYVIRKVEQRLNE